MSLKMKILAGTAGLAAAVGLPTAQPLGIPFRGTLAGRVIARCEAEVLEAGGAVPAEFGYLKGCTDIQAVACAPLIGQGRVLGALAAARRRKIGFSAEDRQLLSLLASQAAIAIENVPPPATREVLPQAPVLGLRAIVRGPCRLPADILRYRQGSPRGPARNRRAGIFLSVGRQ